MLQVHCTQRDPNVQVSSPCRLYIGVYGSEGCWGRCHAQLLLQPTEWSITRRSCLCVAPAARYIHGFHTSDADRQLWQLKQLRKSQRNKILFFFPLTRPDGTPSTDFPNLFHLFFFFLTIDHAIDQKRI